METETMRWHHKSCSEAVVVPQGRFCLGLLVVGVLGALGWIPTVAIPHLAGVLPLAADLLHLLLPPPALQPFSPVDETIPSMGLPSLLFAGT